MYQTYNLSHSDAQAMIETVRWKAESIGKAVCGLVERGRIAGYISLDVLRSLLMHFCGDPEFNRKIVGVILVLEAAVDKAVANLEIHELPSRRAPGRLDHLDRHAFVHRASCRGCTRGGPSWSNMGDSLYLRSKKETAQ